MREGSLARSRRTSIDRRLKMSSAWTQRALHSGQTVRPLVLSSPMIR
jgi:hypothetical protein